MGPEGGKKERGVGDPKTTNCKRLRIRRGREAEKGTHVGNRESLSAISPRRPTDGRGPTKRQEMMSRRERRCDGLHSYLPKPLKGSLSGDGKSHLSWESGTFTYPSGLKKRRRGDFGTEYMKGITVLNEQRTC